MRVLCTFHACASTRCETCTLHNTSTCGPCKQITGLHCSIVVVPCEIMYVKMKVQLSGTVYANIRTHLHTCTAITWLHSTYMYSSHYICIRCTYICTCKQRHNIIQLCIHTYMTTKVLCVYLKFNNCINNIIYF